MSIFMGTECNSALTITAYPRGRDNNIIVNKQNYLDAIYSQQKNVGVPVQINIYTTDQSVPIQKAANGITLNIKVQYESQSSVWKILEIEPLFDFGIAMNAGPEIQQCLDAKYQQYLTKLEGSSIYIGKSPPEKLAYKITLSLYNSLFGFRCFFLANNNNTSCTEEITKGVVFELLETVDIVTLILGSEQLVTQLVTTCATKEKDFITTVFNLTKQVATGNFENKPSNEQINTLISVFLPPCITVDAITKAGELATVLKNEFSQNPCYNSGRLTVVIVPLVLTAGSYAAGKIVAIIPGLVGKAERISLKLNSLFKKAFKLERNAGKYVLKDANGNIVKNYEQFAEFIDDTENLPVGVSGAGSLLNKLDNALFSVLKGKVNDLDNVLKPQFLDDFANASDDILKKLQNDNLFDVWKNDIRSADVAELTLYKSKGSLRKEYTNAVENLVNDKSKLFALGKTKEEVARTLHQTRRDIGVQFKNATPDDLRDWIYRFNIKRYGDNLGPKFDDLFSRAKSSGLTDEQAFEKIIQTSSTPLGDKAQLGTALRTVLKDEEDLSELIKILEKYRM